MSGTQCNFEILGYDVTFSEGEINTIALIQNYNECAIQLVNILRDEYKKVSNMDNFHKNFVKISNSIYMELIHKAVADLQAAKIFDIGEKELRSATADGYRQYLLIMKDKFFQPYEDCQRRAEISKRMELLTRRQEYSDSQLRRDLKRIYNDETRYKSLEAQLLDIVVIAREYVKVAIASKTDTIMELGNCIQATDTIVDNIKKGRIPQGELPYYYTQVLQKNPLNKEIYICILMQYGDSYNELEDLADMFNIELRELKEKILFERYSKVLDKQYESEQEVLQLKEEITQLCEFLGLSTDCHILNYLKNQWRIIDNKLRTVDGVKYETREKAQNVRYDVQLLQDKLQTIDFDSINMLDATQIDKLIVELKELPFHSDLFITSPNAMQRYTMQIFGRNIIRQQRIKNIMESANPAGEVERILKKYINAPNSKNVEYGTFRPISNYQPTYLNGEYPLVFFDNTKLGKWKKYWVFTNKRVINVLKNVVETYNYSTECVIQKNKSDIIFSESEQSNVVKINLGVSWLDEKEPIMESYAFYLSAIIKAMVKMNENGGQMVCKQTVEKDDIMQTISDSNIGMENATSMLSKNTILVDDKEAGELVQEKDVKAEFKFCTNCGTKLGMDYRFCTSCGSPQGS